MKPFRGVLQSWGKIPGKRVRGRIVHDNRHNPETTEFAPDHRIETSKVTRLTPVLGSDFAILETDNSFYVLMGKEVYHDDR
jgi:hypothetical protein